MSAIFNVAGGVRYHIRGWRSAEGRWRPFREALGGWLERWRPGGETLVIVGASGGYCLRMPWLARFDRVACLDPDPIARAVFARRLRAAAPRTRLEWHMDNFLDERAPSAQLERLRGFLARYPSQPVLFSNFLGQLALLMQERGIDPSGALPVWRSRLEKEVLADRPWASFHDRVSGEAAPRFAQPLPAATRLRDDELIARLYPAPDGQLELADHETEGLFRPDREHVYFHWELTPSWVHLIEATHS